MTSLVTSRLVDWTDIASRGWPTLVLGNGFSINVWSGYSYDRLFDEARLPTAAETVFSEIGTTNFETVLEAVMHAQMVLAAMGRESTHVDTLYEQVRDALFVTIRRVHVPHARVATATLEAVADVLGDYDAVFTTNYDLLPYWALMETPRARIADFFWGQGHTFDSESTDLFSGWTGLYFLHGGVHLWQSDSSGLTGKWTSEGGGLLRLQSQYSRYADRRPLFVSEGSTKAKRRTIRRSDYLAFAYEALGSDTSDTVIFGHGLGAQDAHVLRALRRGPRRRFAVSMRPTTGARVLAAKTRIREQLDGHSVIFFDATTHPLGDSSLTVQGP